MSGNLVEAIRALSNEGEILAFLQANEGKIKGAEQQQLLFRACENGYEKVARWLVEKKKTDVNSKDANGETPLHYALRKYENMPVIEMLVEKGSDVNVESEFGQSPLFRALFASDETARFLIQHGDKATTRWMEEEKSLLHLASGKNSLAMVEALLDKGLDIDITDSNGATPLHDAIASRNTEMVAYLISKGADVQARVQKKYHTLLPPIGPTKDNVLFSHFECLPDAGTLHLAALGGDVETAELLIEKGVAVDLGDTMGNQAIHYAAMNLQTDMLGFLLRAGADPNSRNSGEATPLHYVCSFADDGGESLEQQLAAIKLLITKGANIEARALSGKTPKDLVSNDRVKEYLHKGGFTE